MSQSKAVDSTTVVDIGDLENVVGGLSFAVSSLNQTLVSTSALSPVAYNPDTCPTSPGTPLTTCMCPGKSIGGFGTLPIIRY